MGTVWWEMRASVRSLCASPGFTITVVAILALGIGANSTLFSILNAVVLRPIPWEHPESLVNLLEVNAKQGGYLTGASKANYKDWREQSRLLERVSAFRAVHYNLSDANAEPERVPGMSVSADFFPLVGVKPILGRSFLREEEQPSRDHVVLLSNGLWRRRYAADSAVTGRAITIEGESYVVVGVLPDFPMFRILNHAIDLYTPLALPNMALTRDDHSIGVYARLRRGISVIRAQSEMDGISSALAAAYPKTNTDWTVKVVPLIEQFAGRQRAMLEFLLAAACFVLLIACANIASLTLARSVSRRKDLAIRMALGAGRLCIVRRLLAESLILALSGGALGALLAVGSTAFLDRNVSTVELHRMNDFRLDPTVLGLTVGISLAASALFGLGPAIRASRFDANDLLAHASGRGSGGRDTGSLLIVSEVALATMLLIGAAAATRSTQRLLRLDRGIDPHNVLTAQIWMPASRYPTGVSERHFVDRVLERLRALPGVAGASVANYPPLGLLGTAVDFEIEGRPAPALGEAMTARFRIVDPEFFLTMRVPLVKGRAFETGDADEARGVAIVSEAFARRFLPGENAIDKRFRPHFPGGDAFWYPRSANLPLRIVGIARDVRDNDIDTSETPQMYLPYCAESLAHHAFAGAHARGSARLGGSGTWVYSGHRSRRTAIRRENSGRSHGGNLFHTDRLCDDAEHRVRVGVGAGSHGDLRPAGLVGVAEDAGNWDPHGHRRGAVGCGPHGIAKGFAAGDGGSAGRRGRSAGAARNTSRAASRRGSVRPHRVRAASRCFGHCIGGRLPRTGLSGRARGPDCRIADGVARSRQSRPVQSLPDNMNYRWLMSFHLAASRGTTCSRSCVRYVVFTATIPGNVLVLPGESLWITFSADEPVVLFEGP
jgi:putative ABC transport system permease protein